MRRLAVIVFAATALAGCGGSAAVPEDQLSVGAAETWDLAGFEPATSVAAAKAIPLRFSITQPGGAKVTAYRRDNGPHSGVHVIAVDEQLRDIVHLHPPVSPDGTIDTEITLPNAGRNRFVIDAYLDQPDAPKSLYLTRDVTVTGDPSAEPAPSSSQRVERGGLIFEATGLTNAKGLAPSAFTIPVTDANGAPAVFEPYFGAVAHAIFFRRGTLDYFHTHVCGSIAPECAATAGANLGTSETPGVLNVAAILPGSGTWRLFLQVKVGGDVITAPFTVEAS